MPSQFWSAKEGMAPPLWYPQIYNFNENLNDFALRTDLLKVHWMCMVVFHQASLKSGPSGPEQSALLTGLPRLFTYAENGKNWYRNQEDFKWEGIIWKSHVKWIGFSIYFSISRISIIMVVRTINFVTLTRIYFLKQISKHLLFNCSRLLIRISK